MVEISDHAVLRWLQRVKGLDIAAVRAEMATPALDKAVTFGARVVIGRHGERLVLRGNVVVTVIAKAHGAGRTIAP